MITNQELQEAFNKVSEEEEKSHKRMIQRHKEIMEMIDNAEKRKRGEKNNERF